MNRRSFFTKLGLAAASLAILPAATTYARNWKATPSGLIVNPAWVDAPYEFFWLAAPQIGLKYETNLHIPIIYLRPH